MPADLQQLEPNLLWKHFDAIRKIPRCSGNEAAVGNYVIALAEQKDLPYRGDGAGNIVVRKSASPGHEQSGTVILQSHVDMVCEKNAGVTHDFEQDPIRIQIQGEWVTAQGTTLGADNGIGVATALAILEDSSLVHGPVECLFTVDEETGLTGAKRLQRDFITGRTLINLDGGEDGVFFIGCAGGGGSAITLPLECENATLGDALTVTLSGLRGGHSGIDIDKGRGNAIRLLARLLFKVSQEMSLQLAGIEGGNKRNAIPREAAAVIVVPDETTARASDRLSRHFADVQTEFKVAEPDMTLTVTPHAGQGIQTLTPGSQLKVFGLLLGYPNGVLAVSQEMAGLVETSNNLAVVRTEEARLHATHTTRSSRKPALEAVRDAIRAMSEMAGADVEQEAGYPGWSPNLDSALLQVCQNVYQKLFGAAPAFKMVHAGLEPGVIGDIYSDMDMISLGPQIESPHSPNERVRIVSVARFWQFVTAILEELA